MCKTTRASASPASAAAALAAVTRLLDERGPDDLTITEVVAEAGLTRPTFYAAFGDLTTACETAALARLDEALPVDGPAESDEDIESAFLTTLTGLNEHADFFDRILRSSAGHRVQTRLIEHLAERIRTTSPLAPDLARGPLPLDVSSSALAAAVTWTMIDWLHTEPSQRRDLPELAALLRELVVSAVRTGLGRTEGDR